MPHAASTFHTTQYVEICYKSLAVVLVTHFLWRVFIMSSTKDNEGDSATGETNSADTTKSPTSSMTNESPKEKKLEPEQQYTLWGLGRGVDITKPTPWLEKTSFQVRKVRSADLIETQEGGLLKAYSDVVSNSTTIHSQVRSGVKAPDIPLSIGVDAEYSHTECTSKHVVGLKVKNRTISFRVDFHDVPESWVSTVEAAREQLKKKVPSKEQANTVSSPTLTLAPDKMMTGCEEVPFETRLCKWLRNCLILRGVRLTDSPPEQFCTATINNENKSLIDCDKETKLLEKDIDHFIEHFGVTHYVSAIELGALRFSVLTEKEYEKKVAASGSASLNSKLYGGLEVSASHSNKKSAKTHHSERKEIGKLTKDGEREKVDEKDEAVIGCQIRPISSLVKNPYLQQAIKSSVKKYTQTTISTGGPYLLSCGDYDTKLYLRAHPESKILIVTHDKNMADAFTVMTVSETKHHHELEFSLTSSLSKSKKKALYKEGVNLPTSEDPSQCGDDAIAPLDYILEIPVNPLTGNGFQTNKPRMRLNSDYQRTRLLLKKRTDNRISCDTKEWIKGREAYYIQCIRRMHSGFLCVKMRKSYNKTTTQQAIDQDLNAGDRECDNTEQQHEVAEEQIPAFDETPRNQGGASVSSIEEQPGLQQIDHQDSQRPTDQKSKKDIGPGGATVSSVEEQPSLQPLDHQDSQQPTDRKFKKDIRPGSSTVSSIEEQPSIQPIGRQDSKQPTDQKSKEDIGHKEMMERYKVCVKSSPTSHDDERNVFMLFRLQPTTY